MSKYSNNQEGLRALLREAGLEADSTKVDAEFCWGNINELSKEAVEAICQAVLDSGNAEYNYRAAMAVEGADIEKHLKVVLDSGNAHYNYRAAMDVKGADIEKHCQVVLDSGDAYSNYRAARDVKGADIEKHLKVGLDSGDAYWIKQAKEMLK